MATVAMTFSRSQLGVSLSRAVEGTIVFEGSDLTQIGREVAARGLTELQLSSMYSIRVPTNCDTLAEAAKQPLRTR